MSKAIVISESEKKKILGLYGLIKEDNCVGDCENGVGTLTKDDGSKLGGYFKDGNLIVGKIELDDVVYKGDFKTNENGITYLVSGTTEHKDGTIAKGNFDFDNRLQGEGEYTEGNTGRVLKGYFVDDYLNGKGKIIDRDGTTYEGTFVNDKMNGICRVTLPNGKITEGYYEYGEFKKPAKYEEPSTQTDSGKIEEPPTQINSGKTIIDNDEGYYEGEVENGKPHGKGKLHNISSESDGKIYVSPFRPNFHDDTFTYEGSFDNGKPEGEGKITFENGDVYEGEFYDGKIDGIGKMTFANGSVYNGEFETISKDSLKSTYKVKTKTDTIEDLVKYNSERPRVTDVYSDLTNQNKTKGILKSGTLTGFVKATLSKNKDPKVVDGLKDIVNNETLSTLTIANKLKPTTAKITLQHKTIESISYNTESDYEGNFEFENIELGDYLLTVDASNKFSSLKNYNFKMDNQDKEITIILSDKKLFMREYFEKYYLNEDDNSATIFGIITGPDNTPLPDTKVTLLGTGKNYGAISDINGKYEILDVPIGLYKIKFINNDYGSTELENLEITSNTKFEKNYKFTKVVTKDEVKVTTDKSKTEQVCVVDVSVLDEDGENISNAYVSFFINNENVANGNTDENGKLSNFVIPYNDNFKRVNNTPCEDKSKVQIVASFKGKKSIPAEFQICVFNGLKTKKDVTRIKTDSYDMSASNIFKVPINTQFEYSISAIDSENDTPLSNATINVYSDNTKKELLASGKGSVEDFIKLDRRPRNFERSIDVYYEISNEGYDTETGELKIKRRGENKFEIELDKNDAFFKFKLEKVVDSQDKPLSDVSFTIFDEKRNPKALSQGTIPFEGKIKKEIKRNSEPENRKIVFINLSKNGYTPKTFRLKLSSDKNNNNFNFELTKIGLEKEKEKPLTEVQVCENTIEQYYQTYVSLYRKSISANSIDKTQLKKDKQKIVGCHTMYRNKLSKKSLDYIKQLTNVYPSIEFMEITLQVNENKNVYSNSSNLNDTIKNIIKEQKEIKSSILVEKKLIEKRFDFVIKSLISQNNVSDRKFISELQTEKNKMIKLGYDSLIVQDSFFNVINTFF